MQVQTPGSQNDNAGVEKRAEVEPYDDRAVERLVLHGDKLLLAATTACSRCLLTAGLIYLDVAGTQLENSGLEAIVAWTPWLRGLSAAGNYCEVLKEYNISVSTPLVFAPMLSKRSGPLTSKTGVRCSTKQILGTR